MDRKIKLLSQINSCSIHLIHKLDPDVICIQEIQEQTRNHLQCQLQNEYKCIHDDLSTHGTAIFSRIKIIGHVTTSLTSIPKRNFLFVIISGKSMLGTVHLEVPCMELSAFVKGYPISIVCGKLDPLGETHQNKLLTKGCQLQSMELVEDGFIAIIEF